MARFKYNQNIEGHIGFVGDLTLQVKKKGELAIWTDQQTSATIEVHGKA